MDEASKTCNETVMTGQNFVAAAPLRILVVDDEEVIRYYLEKILVKAGYHATLAGDAQSAYALMEKERFDIGIVDRMLPHGENGLDIIKMLKSRNSLCEVILISAQPTLDSARESLHYETLAYISKPFTHEEICAAVRRAERKILDKKAAEE